MSKRARITATKKADRNSVVHTVVGGDGGHCKVVCPECPWRVENAGKFPAKAFVHSANTAEDMSFHTFGCHMSGVDKPKTCAGFLLRGSADNLRVRIGRSKGEFLDVVAGRAKLHATYKTMAVANGVPADSPALALCMPEARFTRIRRPLKSALDEVRRQMKEKNQ